jgi:glycosyltransferase involved in cell wall biosynthesis
MEACSVSRTALVVHFHGFDAYHHETLTELREPYRRLFQKASRVIAVSNHMLDQLVDLGCPSERIVLNPYGVDINRFDGARPKEAAPLLLALGRLVPKKGPLLTLRAFARVQAEEPQTRLVMLGDGPLIDQCVEVARELGIDHNVDFPGSVDHVEVAAWMRQARCFVQHSLRAEDGDSEGTPVAVLEASSCGLPVVSTKHAGIVDAVIDGTGGFLVEEGDIDGMARQMLRLVREPALAEKMGAAARQHVKANYSSERRLERLRSVLLGVSRIGVDARRDRLSNDS